MQLLRDNLTLWTSSAEKETEETTNATETEMAAEQ